MIRLRSFLGTLQVLVGLIMVLSPYILTRFLPYSMILFVTGLVGIVSGIVLLSE
ncbi:MAG: hypothetical protein ACE5OY_04070 [Candidatus Bathyarchaeia archaeon]